VLIAVSRGDQTVYTGEVQVDLVGQSGQIKLTTTHKNWIKLSWDKIQEINATTGGVVQFVNNFASQQFSVSNPMTAACDSSTTGTKFVFMATVTPTKKGTPVNMNVTVWLNLTDTATGAPATSCNGNPVGANQVKFDISVSSWPFVDPSDKLSFGAVLDYKGGKSVDPSNATHVQAGPGSVTSSQTASYDGTNGPVTVTTYSSTGKTGIQWQFNSFTNSLVYDPSVQAGAPGLIPSLGLLLCLIAATQLK